MQSLRPRTDASSPTTLSRIGRVLGAAAVLFAALVAPASAYAQDRSLVAGDQAARPAPIETGVTRAQAVTVDLSLLSAIRDRLLADPSVPQQIVLPTFGGPMTLNITHVEIIGTANALHGSVEGVELSSVVLVERQGVVAGNINARETNYQIRYRGPEFGHELREFNQGLFRDHDHDAAPPPQPEVLEGPGLKATQADDGSIIDVMVAYTPAARAAAGGTPAMQALIALAVSETNAAYSSSGVTQRLRLVHSLEVAYTESGDFSLDLNRVIGKTDGHMDQVHAARDLYGADLVSLWIENSGTSCGIAPVMTLVSASFANSAFNVVNRSCATGYYSFGHELGHNMGLRHDVFMDSGVTPFAYAHGYVDTVNRFRTVMGYNNACGNANCPRIQRFSNPSVNYGAAATGNALTANARLALDNTRLIVANFRAAVLPVGVAPTCTLDVDGNGRVDALTDGLMIMRAMFGVTGSQVTAHAVGSGATRTTWAQVSPLVSLPVLDVDGNGNVDAMTDGLMIMRAMFGLTGAQVTNNALGTSPVPVRNTWALIRTYLNATCGTAFLP